MAKKTTEKTTEKTEKKTAKKPKIKIVERHCLIKLTEAETLERAKSAADSRVEVVKLETLADSATQEFKSKITLATEKQNRLLGIVKTESEWRYLDCKEIPNFDENIVEYTFEGEIVDSRKMSESEKQVEMRL